MRAVAVFPRAPEIRLVDHPEPQILAPSQVAIRVREVGICGTDREIAAGAHGSPPDGSPYLVLGHEALGEVVEVGTSVSRLRRGDLVVPTVRRPCRDMRCHACATGHPDFCTTGEFIQRGIRGAHGYLAERVVDEQRYMVPVPAELRDVAVLTQPLSVAEAALKLVESVQRRLPWSEDVEGSTGRSAERVAVVIGAGPVGALAALALRVRGYTTSIYSREPRGKKSELVQAFGVGWASRRDETPEALAGRIGPIDLVVDAAGAAPLAFEALPWLGPNGVFVFTGIPGRKGPVPRELASVMPGIVLKNQAVLGVTTPSVEAYRAAVADLALFARRWPMLVPQLVTSRHPIAEAGEVRAATPRGFQEVLTFE